MLTPDSKTFTGTTTLGNLTIEGPHDDALGISGSVRGSGALTYA